MLSKPEDLWSNQSAWNYFQRRFRYLIARYGYSPALMAWELWNEVDLTDNLDANGANAEAFFNKRLALSFFFSIFAKSC